MYFLKIYWFRGINHLLSVEGGPKVKSVKNGSFKNIHFLHKIDHNSKILLFVGKILFHIRILQVILHLICQKLGPKRGTPTTLLSHQSWRPKNRNFNFARTRFSVART